MVAAAVWCCMAAHTVAAQQNPMPTRHLELRVAAPNIWYRDFPLWILITITNSSKQAIEITRLDYWDVSTPITILAKTGTGQALAPTVSVQAFSWRGGEVQGGRELFIPKEKWNLAPADVRDCTLNLGRALEALGAVSGQYEVRLRLWANTRDIVAESAPLSVQIADQPVEALKSVLPKTAVTTTGPVNDLEVSLADLRLVSDREVRGSLAFSLLVRKLIWPKDRDTVSIPQYLPELPTRLLPTAEAFQFELKLQSGDAAGASPIKEEVLRQNSGMAYWFREAELGRGALKTSR